MYMYKCIYSSSRSTLIFLFFAAIHLVQILRHMKSSRAFELSSQERGSICTISVVSRVKLDIVFGGYYLGVCLCVRVFEGVSGFMGLNEREDVSRDIFERYYL